MEPHPESFALLQIQAEELNRDLATAMRMSIRELLFVTGVVALCVAGLTSGPPIAWIGVSIICLLLTVFAINIAVAPLPIRNFSIGFLLAALAYLSLTYLAGPQEYGTSGEVLPTTRVIQWFLEPDYEKVGMTGDSVRARKAYAVSVMPLGHLFVAAILGYAGGWYARLVSASVVHDSQTA